jgi:hypothetical protein
LFPRCGFGKALLFLPYGEMARKTRKLMHAEISQHVVQKHHQLQEREVQRFVQRLSTASSETIWEDTRRFVLRLDLKKVSSTNAAAVDSLPL